MNQLLEQFLNEARDNLAYLDENLESLQEQEVDTDALFRAAHTLKGGAGLVGFESVQRLTHKAEDILDKYRHKEIAYSEFMLEVLFDIFDEVVEIIDAAEELGDIPEPNEQKIEELAKQAQKVLDADTKDAQADTVATEPSVDTALPIVTQPATALENFEDDKLAALLPELPFSVPTLTAELLTKPTHYLIDFDLDVDTISLGNDPYYLLSLFDDELKLVWLQINKSCEDIEKDPIKWATRILAVVESDEEMIEDICENILDEITLYPIAQQSYFLTTKPAGENELISEFVGEFEKMLESGDFSMLDEHITASLKLLNPQNKESFILTRLQNALVKFDLGSDEFAQVAKHVAHLLDMACDDGAKDAVESSADETDQQDTQTSSEDTTQSLLQNLDAVGKKALINILKQQKQILEVSSDEKSLQRIKHTLATVLKDEKVQQSLENIGSGEDMGIYIDRLMAKVGNVEDASQETPQLDAATEDVEQDTQKQEAQPVKTQKSSSQSQEDTQKAAPKQGQKLSAIGKTVKIDQYQIDGLMDNIGELLVMKNAMPYIVETLRADTVEQTRRDILTKYDEISRVTSQLQETVMAMRLLPLSYIFGRYPKLVRDLSKKLDKKIKYEEEGGETKLDKTMIENLADPMVHLIRNSIDHGIESKDQRVAKGKPEAGVISIKAHSEGDKVIININDDGKGIDPQVIMNKALENNLVDAEKADSMSKEEILGLIFYSGLTTKEQISDLSGRGVGMDAVRTAIEKLNGNITVTSEIDEGTNIKLELPVSVALTNVFHVKMRERNYAIAMDYLVETSQVSKKDIQESDKKLFIQRRGELVPVIYPKALIDADSKDREIQKMIVLQVGEKKFAVVVDEFVNQLDVVQKPFNGALKKHSIISGSSLLGNGSVLFVLDVNKLDQLESWS